VPENHGGPEFEAAMKVINESSPPPLTLVPEGDDFWINVYRATKEYVSLGDLIRLRRTGPPAEHSQLLQHAVDQSRNWPNELRPLLAYDCLNELPDSSNDFPAVAVLPIRTFGSRMDSRLKSLLACGRHTELAEDALLQLELAQRLQHPWNFISAELAAEFELQALRWVTFCASQGFFTPEQAHTLVTRAWPAGPTLIRLLEDDCAFHAHIWAVYGAKPHRELDSALSEDDRAYRTGWFSWASTRRGRRRSYDHPQRVLAEHTLKINQAIERLEAARRGESPALPEPELPIFATDSGVRWISLRPLWIKRLQAALDQDTGGRFERKTEGDTTTLHLREDGLDAATLKALDSHAGKELRVPLQITR